jgi:hypothetical protein
MKHTASRCTFALNFLRKSSLFLNLKIKKMKEEMKSNLQSNRHDDTGPSILSNQVLSNNDVCSILRISKRTLQNYRNNNVLPFSQIGRKIYYRASDIEAYLEAHYIKTKEMKGLVA